MPTGHPDVESDAKQHMTTKAAYTKTVENGDWVVKTEYELTVEQGVPVHLVFARRGNNNSICENDRIFIT